MMSVQETVTRIKALHTFATLAPKGVRNIEDATQHISHVLKIDTEDNTQIKIAIIVVSTQGLTLAQLATLQAYKDRGYTYSYILAHSETDIYYCEISQVAGHVNLGTFKLNKDCMKTMPIG